MKKFKLFWIMVMVILMTAMSVNGLLGDDLLGYWDFENTSSEGQDKVAGNYNITNTGCSYGATAAKLGDRGYLCELTEYLTYANMPTDDVQTNLDDTFSWSGWIQPKGNAGNHWIFGHKDIGASDTADEGFYLGWLKVNDTLRFNILDTGTGTNVWGTQDSCPVDVWCHVAFSWNGSEPTIWINGSESVLDDIKSDGSGVINAVTDGEPALTGLIKWAGGTPYYSDDYFDEFAFWNRTLTDSDVTTLWNDSNGITYPFPADQLEIDFFNQSPVNNSSIGIKITDFPYDLDFTFNVTSNTQDYATCNLSRNGTELNVTTFQTNVTTLWNISHTITDEINFTEYQYNLSCNNSAVNFTDTGKTIYILADNQTPYITFNTPLSDNSTEYYNFNYDNVTINVTFWDDNLYNTTINLYYPNGTLKTSVNNNSHSVTNYTEVFTQDLSSEPAGDYMVEALACDGHTKQKIDEWEDITIGSGVIDFGNCRIYPDSLMKDIGYYGYQYQYDRYTWTYEWLKSDSSRSYFLECREEEELIYLPDSEYAGHFIHGQRWIDFETQEDYPVSVNKITDHKYKITYNVGENADPFMTTESIGELNCREQNVTFFNKRYNTIEALEFPINDFIVDSATYVTILNESFNLSTSRHLDFFGDGVLYKSTSPVSSDVYVRIILNNVTLFDELINSVSDIDNYKSFTLPNFDSPSGLVGSNVLEIAVRETGSGDVGFQNFDITAMTNQTQGGKGREHTDINFTGSVSTAADTFQQIINWSVESAADAEIMIDINHKFDNSVSGVTKTCYIQNLNTSQNSTSYTRNNSVAVSTGSGGMSWIFDSSEIGHDVVNISFALYCKHDTTDSVDYRVFGVGVPLFARDLTDEVHINNRQAFNHSVQSLTAGSTEILSMEVPIINSSAFGMGMTIIAQSTSGEQSGTDSPFFWTNSSRCAFVEGHNRSFTDEGEIGIIKIYAGCPNNVIGENTTFFIHVDVAAGETLDILNVSLNGFEFSALNSTEINLPPVAAAIITPADNGNVTNTFLINWSAFTDPNGDNVTYNVTLHNVTDGSLLDNISLGINNTNTTYDISGQVFGVNYTLNVTGCDDFGLCSSKTITIYHNDPEPTLNLSIVPSVVPLDNGSVNITWNITDNNIDVSLLNVTLSGVEIYSSAANNGSVVLDTSSTINQTGTYIVLFTMNESDGDDFNSSSSFIVTPVNLQEYVPPPVNQFALIGSLPSSLVEVAFLFLVLVLCGLMTAFAAHDRTRGLWFIAAISWFVYGIIIFNYSFAFGLILLFGSLGLAFMKIID